MWVAVAWVVGLESSRKWQDDRGPCVLCWDHDGVERWPLGFYLSSTEGEIGRGRATIWAPIGMCEYD